MKTTIKTIALGAALLLGSTSFTFAFVHGGDKVGHWSAGVLLSVAE